MNTATATLPAVFFGHGNPMNALEENAFTRTWRAFGAAAVRPKAVLAISAHWFVPRTSVTTGDAPKTIHDFGAFPDALFRVQYPAPGDAGLEARAIELLAPDVAVSRDAGWGLDHGTWSVLCHVFPDADVPVVQLAIDRSKPPAYHYALGRRLAPLRDEGVLIVGSGNVVHNLRAYAWGDARRPPYDWAERFEAHARAAIVEGRHEALVDYLQLGADAALSAPTPEHFLPLLYVLGASRPGDTARFVTEGVDGGSISMLSVQLGGEALTETA